MSWGSSKQTRVTLLSTKAEFVAMSVAATEIKFVVSILTENGAELPFSSSNLPEDNMCSIFTAKNTPIDQRTKHIDIWCQFVNDMV